MINNDKQIRDLKQRLKEFDEEMSSGSLQKSAEETVNYQLQVNKAVIENIEKYRAKVKNNLNDYNEKLSKQEEVVKRLSSKKDKLDAEKQLIPLLNNEVEPIKNDSKVAFYISTNIARLGIMIVTIFLAQIFISIYRYLTRISNFYHARADALEILTQTEALKNTDLSGLIEMYSNIYFHQNKSILEECLNHLLMKQLKVRTLSLENPRSNIGTVKHSLISAGSIPVPWGESWLKTSRLKSAVSAAAACGGVPYWMRGVVYFLVKCPHR